MSLLMFTVPKETCNLISFFMIVQIFLFWKSKLTQGLRLNCKLERSTWNYLHALLIMIKKKRKKKKREGGGEEGGGGEKEGKRYYQAKIFNIKTTSYYGNWND